MQKLKETYGRTVGLLLNVDVVPRDQADGKQFREYLGIIDTRRNVAARPSSDGCHAHKEWTKCVGV